MEVTKENYYYRAIYTKSRILHAGMKIIPVGSNVGNNVESKSGEFLEI